jgi:hypothetical protein
VHTINTSLGRIIVDSSIMAEALKAEGNKLFQAKQFKESMYDPFPQPRAK